jgi:Ni,Fe-hydrogenase I small subunit
VTFQNCPNIGWNENTNWPIACGHPCIGCAEPAFWDRMTPFYSHLTGVPGFGAAADIDKVGLYATAAVATGFVAHSLVQIGKRAVDRARAPKPPPPGAEPEPEAAKDEEQKGDAP